MKKNINFSGRPLAGPAVLLLITTCSVFLGACAKLPVAKSYWHDDLNKQDVAISGYDPGSGIRYIISNDNENLFVSFDTDSRRNIMNIMMNGIKIYIDTNNKKKGSMYLLYPYRSRKHNRSEYQQREGMERPETRPMMKSPPEGLWYCGGETQVINFKLDKTGFNGSIQFDSLGFMKYNICIPLTAIKPGGIDTLDIFALGIEGESLSGPPGGGTGMRPGGGEMRGEGQMPGGSRPGGMRPQGARPGGARPGGDRQGSDMFSSEPIKIWVSTQLVKPIPD